MVDIDRLAAEIVGAVKNYTEDVSAGIEKRVDEVADLIKEDASSDAPKRTGDYAKGFKVTKQDRGGAARRVIWNKRHGRRVQLLEFGHAKRRGGRVAARPHLRPAYDRHAGGLTNDIKRIIRNGG